MSVNYEIIDIKDIEVIRPLFDELMVFQKSKAYMMKEVFDQMTMQTRIYDELAKNPFKEIYVILVKDKGEPVGFAYSAVDKEDIGKLKLFYLKEAYRGKGIGNTLFTMSMEWIKQFDTKEILIAVSNGNDAARKFYKDHGFEFKEDMFGGFITILQENK